MEMLGPRTDRLSHNDVFMLQAISASWRSPDPNTKVGCSIIHPQSNTVVSTGYNAFPRGISQNVLPWDRDKENPLDNKYLYVCHAELNAICNSHLDLRGCHAYITMYSCNECAKVLIQKGIKRVYYLTNPYKDLPSTEAARRMFEHLDIPCEQFKWQSPKLIQAYLDSLKTSIL